MDTGSINPKPDGRSNRAEYAYLFALHMAFSSY